ncbi:MAG: FAD-binding protein [Bacteroidales bacterium]|nr:FAD-binding protein [Bacteroidales bacterium]MBN2757746.1 FAD-binding protein [Bacteroidales bacterium]
MSEQITKSDLNILKKNIKGEIFFDNISKIIYSTDASSYKEKPLAIAIPKTNTDILEIIKFANKNKISVIPRAAGTSLAGQVVGNGIIVDISKNFREIIELNVEEKWVKVQAGVVLDELNLFLEKHNLFFGPETSTSNRCMIGGMIGNNSCGSHSVIYGSTRDHTLEIKAFLSDGSEVLFKELNKNEFTEKCKLNNHEGEIYRNINSILSDEKNKNEIKKEYPHFDIKRRNTGYAIDLLLNTNLFSDKNENFNFSKLIAGSEGTLAFASEIKLNLIDLPPKNKVIIAVHFNSLEESLHANLIALKHKPGAVELVDETILEITKDNLSQKNNRFFINGNPKAILLIEFARQTIEELKKIAENLEKDMRNAGFGYHFPSIYGDDIKKVWNLRKAGLGVLSNLKGDAKPLGFIEDTAVRVEDMPNYIADFKQILKKYSLDCVFHAHIGSGELHLRPVLNLKKQKDVDLYYQISLETAHLVKKYNGSLSGEHGDGRLRSEFIPIMIGEHNYNILKEVKKCWDPLNIFNQGKITDSPQMDKQLRFKPNQPTRQVDTIFDFSSTLGYVRAAENCNGSGDCRKSHIIGGTMCPSYQASKNEKNTTRARANLLREILNDESVKQPFASEELYEILDLCLSCKACKSECPSGVDMTKLKAEFLQHYYDIHHVPIRSFLVANISKINKLLSIFPSISNFFLKNKFFSSISMNLIGFEAKRKMPLLSETTLLKFYKKHNINTKNNAKKVYLFADEFTNFNDADIGIKTILLLEKLNYQVIIPKHFDSGRTFLSKGLIKKAKVIAEQNINLFKDLITDKNPLIGIEPSTILTFRDEYLDFFDKESDTYKSAKKISANTFMIDEFLAGEMKSGNISKELFTKEAKKIKLHGHCQQKAIASTESSKYILSFPENYQVEEIPSGCCGMAGSFGYEKEHYELSMKIGELVLFPAVRNASSETLIAAPGTSCRHQIKDGTNKTALHPVEILWKAIL